MSNILHADRRIEILKNEWAKRGDSPFHFWKMYIRLKHRLSYKKFLRKINWDGELTYGIADAIKIYMSKNGKINQKTQSSKKKK